MEGAPINEEAPSTAPAVHVPLVVLYLFHSLYDVRYL